MAEDPPYTDITPTESIQVYELNSVQILQLVEEAMKARTFVGGQPGTTQSVQCYSKLPITTSIIFSVSTKGS